MDLKVQLVKLGAFALGLAALAPAAFSFAQASLACPTAGNPAVVTGSCRLALPDAGNAYLGIYADPSLPIPDSDFVCTNENCGILLREGKPPQGIDRTFAFHLHYYKWTDLADQVENGTFPDTELQSDIYYNRVPVISWGCDSATTDSDEVIGDPTNSGYAAEETVIEETAQALARYPGPVVLRWFWEFNLDSTENETCRGDDKKRANFKAAWINIWSTFQSEGATNVMFLWNPGYTGGPEHLETYYPGTAYVDWIGVDTYQKDTSDTFTDNFGLFYNCFSSYGKPMIVGENGSQNYSVADIEYQKPYLDGLLSDLKNTGSNEGGGCAAGSALVDGPYPMLKAYDYWDQDGNADNWILDEHGGVAELAKLGQSAELNAVPQSCSITLPQAATGVVGPGVVPIRVETSTPNCPWSVGPLPSTIRVESPGEGATLGEGVGPGAVTLYVEPSREPRKIEIGGQFITVTTE